MSRHLDGTWAIVLAGGEGSRLRPLTRRVCGDDRPKQYVPLLGSRSLLRQTLDRVSLAVPGGRVVVVTRARDARYTEAELAAGARARVLAQPCDRGTAAAILYPAHWISWRAPDSVVAVFPSDHHIVEESVFMAHVRAVVSFVQSHPDRVVLLGARPTYPATDLGWIETGRLLGEVRGEPVLEIRRFDEKPSATVARHCFAAGALWNTLVVVAHVAALLEVGRQWVPELSEHLERLESLDGREDTEAVQEAFVRAPAANFSRDVLVHGVADLAVARLPALTWSDWGTPERVLETLQAMGLTPPWLEMAEQTA